MARKHGDDTMTEIRTTLIKYIVTDGVYPHEIEATSPRAAAEALLDGYEWREDLADEYGAPEGFDGEVRDTDGCTLATFRATPAGIMGFIELPR